MQGQDEEGGPGPPGDRRLTEHWATSGVPYYCTVLANASAHLGDTEDGLQALAEAHTLVKQQEER